MLRARGGLALGQTVLGSGLALREVLVMWWERSEDTLRLIKQVFTQKWNSLEPGEIYFGLAMGNC